MITADRELVESGADDILADADTDDIAFLVVGDPFGATTHTDLVLRAKTRGIPTKAIHNASIMNAVGACGLQLYNFGQTVSMVFFLDNWKPASFYDRIKENRDIGLHTLVLGDIKVKEQSMENLARGRKIYEPSRYMLSSQTASQMLEIEEDKKLGVYGPDSLAISISKLGSEEQRFVSGTLAEIAEADEKTLGGPLHSLVLLGKRAHVLELQFIRDFALNRETFEDAVKREYGEMEWESFL